jgi:hypothetical protein
MDGGETHLRAEWPRRQQLARRLYLSTPGLECQIQRNQNAFFNRLCGFVRV